MEHLYLLSLYLHAAFIASPYSAYTLYRNPRNINVGKFITLSAFLDLTKSTKSLSGILISIDVSSSHAYLYSFGMGGFRRWYCSRDIIKIRLISLVSIINQNMTSMNHPMLDQSRPRPSLGWHIKAWTWLWSQIWASLIRTNLKCT